MIDEFVVPSKEAIFSRLVAPLFRQQNAQSKDNIAEAIKNARLTGMFMPEADVILLRVIGDILRRATYRDSNGKAVSKYLYDEKEETWSDQELLAHLSTRNPAEPDIWVRRGGYVRRLTRAERRKRRVRDGITKKIVAMGNLKKRVVAGEVFKAPSLWDERAQ